MVDEESFPILVSVLIKCDAGESFVDGVGVLIVKALCVDPKGVAFACDERVEGGEVGVVVGAEGLGSFWGLEGGRRGEEGRAVDQDLDV